MVKILYFRKIILDFLWNKDSFSFGWDTFHALGIIHKSFAIGNGLGIFGKMSCTDSLYILLRVGLSHHNEHNKIYRIFEDRNFGPYVHLGIRYHL